MESFLGLYWLYFFTNDINEFYTYMPIIKNHIDYSLNYYPMIGLWWILHMNMNMSMKKWEKIENNKCNKKLERGGFKVNRNALCIIMHIYNNLVKHVHSDTKVILLM